MRYIALLLFLLAGCSKTDHKPDHLYFDCPKGAAQVKPGPDGTYIISCPKPHSAGTDL